MGERQSEDDASWPRERPGKGSVGEERRAAVAVTATAALLAERDALGRPVRVTRTTTRS